ncbi:MAG: hypothetical protein OEV42_18680 [Deltaproteobacteria bacterium]|nr:hypothetical protein [Deltaproteobacteria bacterium]
MEKAYLITMSLLIFHQIDAAYWKEWEMFHLPGGVQGYLVFNIIAIPVLLNGYKHAINKTESAKIYSYLCGSLGLLTFLIHAAFTAFGARQFDLPLSILIIVLCFLSGAWQLILIRRSAT